MTDGEPETVVLASLQKIKLIKNPVNFFNFFYFIKSGTSDSFVNHFDGHFAYLKTLDFYFKAMNRLFICICSRGDGVVVRPIPTNQPTYSDMM